MSFREKERKMKIGISIASGYDVENVRDGAQWMLERAKAAADAGLDSLFFGDHHVTQKPYYQNTPILTRALADWPTGPAGALYLLPFRHPVLLAEEIATLATITPDRFVMQCGMGHGKRKFAAFGINARHRPSRFEECLGISCTATEIRWFLSSRASCWWKRWTMSGQM
jgi:alkanesulfonate monooxygenase SsuD/methylene tetrahydromethanopterin reductase-like flavin-dependent oxidoreductase (luciferase family)